MFKDLLFGTAGIPLCAKGSDTIGGIAATAALGLDAMELEFVHSTNIAKEKTALVKEAAEKNSIALTCHGQYYVNLNALEHEKIVASKKRMIDAAVIASWCGARSICFHMAYYMKKDPAAVYKIVKSGIKDVVKNVHESGHEIWIRPELTGKPAQWGSLDEIIKISQDLEGVLPCIDFAHLHAREGKYNTYEEFAAALGKIESGLGRPALENMHIHMAGINYGKKGELNHLPLEESDLNFLEILRTWRDFRIKGVVISESPNIEKDSLMLKKTYFQCNR